ncbi:hypothetical protein K1719_023563 [Acacia pycnantha]|nr:hypothetical protein K1719_023563 [Acacia pycnantha]
MRATIIESLHFWFHSLKFVLASKTSTVSVWISEIHSGERGRKHSQGKRFTSFSFALQIPYGRSLASAIAAHRASRFRNMDNFDGSQSDSGKPEKMKEMIWQQILQMYDVPDNKAMNKH